MNIKEIIRNLIFYKTIDCLLDINKFWILRKKIINNEKVFLGEYRYRKFMEYYGCCIPKKSVINRFITPHELYSIFISQGAEIGNNCVIYQGVTVGSNTLDNSKNIGAPKIGNNVFIGAGAIIIGGIKIGNNVRIGANCIVTKDIPDNATVVMPSPRIIVHKEKRNNIFVPWKNN